MGSITFGAVVSIAVTIDRLIRERRQLVVKLQEGFLSPDFYAKVRAPAYKVTLQWAHLPEEIRSDYRDAVASGWAFDAKTDKLATYVAEVPYDKTEIASLHFQKPAGDASLTEHQALTALLRFWTRVNVYRKNGSINRRLTRQLLGDEFAYTASFFKELSETVDSKLQDSHFRPRWINDISELDRFFAQGKGKKNA